MEKYFVGIPKTNEQSKFYCETVFALVKFMIAGEGGYKFFILQSANSFLSVLKVSFFTYPYQSRYVCGSITLTLLNRF